LAFLVGYRPHQASEGIQPEADGAVDKVGDDTQAAEDARKVAQGRLVTRLSLARHDDSEEDAEESDQSE